MFPKPQTLRDEKYKAWIRNTICLICHKPGPIEPHHEPEKGGGAKGLKCSDRRCLPLCNEHHRARHDLGKRSFAKLYGLDYEWAIAELNRIYDERNAP